MRASRLLTIVLISLGLIFTSGASASAAVSQSEPTALSQIRSGNAKEIRSLARDVLEDISVLDERLADGRAGGMPSRLELLANTFDRLANTKPPRRVPRKKFRAQALTLAGFARTAANEFADGQVLDGSARYVVIREQTARLLKMINRGLKTKFELPVLEPSDSESDVDTSSIALYTQRIVEDINALDEWVRDGIGMTSRLLMLARSYQSLADGSVPPGVDAAEFRSRAATLAQFAELAATEYSYGQELEGSARYAVIREETIPLLQAVNLGLGTSFALP